MNRRHIQKVTANTAGLRRAPGTRAARRGGWVLLETVIATGTLIVGLAVIGVQIQQADSSLRQMQLKIRSIMLAEMYLAEMDLGLIELDSVDDVQEEDFGPRYPDFGWRLTIDETAREEVFLLKLEVLYLMRDGEYEPDTFDHDHATTTHTVYAMKPAPRPLDMGADFGLDDEELIELGEKLDVLGIEGLSVDALDPTILASLNFEEFLEVLPLLADALRIDVSQLLGSLPPDLLDALEQSGVLDAIDEETESPAGEGEE